MYPGERNRPIKICLGTIFHDSATRRVGWPLGTHEIWVSPRGVGVGTKKREEGRPYLTSYNCRSPYPRRLVCGRGNEDPGESCVTCHCSILSQDWKEGDSEELPSWWGPLHGDLLKRVIPRMEVLGQQRNTVGSSFLVPTSSVQGRALDQTPLPSDATKSDWRV